MKRLPDTELEVMKALWAAGEDTPRAVLEQALEPFGWATNTVNTYLTRLEKTLFYRDDAAEMRKKIKEPAILPVTDRHIRYDGIKGDMRDILEVAPSHPLLSQFYQLYQIIEKEGAK